MAPLFILLLSSTSFLTVMGAATLGTLVTAPTGTVFFAGSTTGTMDTCACVDAGKDRMTTMAYVPAKGTAAAGLQVVEYHLVPAGAATGTVFDILPNPSINDYGFTGGNVTAAATGIVGQASMIAFNTANNEVELQVGNTVVLTPSTATSCIFTAFTNLLPTGITLACLTPPVVVTTTTVVATTTTTLSRSAAAATSSTSSLLPSSSSAASSTPSSSVASSTPSSSGVLLTSVASPTTSSSSSSQVVALNGGAPGGITPGGGIGIVPSMTNPLFVVIVSVSIVGVILGVTAGVMYYRSTQRPVADLSKWSMDGRV